MPTDRTRTWLGPPYWANWLQDWRLSRGRLECVTTSGPMRTRTVAVLTRELVAGDRPARIGVRTGLLAEGEGFSGFLIGAGSGALDHRATALVQGASGEGGGILCVYYGAFRYGVSFALVEDRKFKNGDKDNRDPTGRRYGLTILGDRQERFLGEWAAADPGSPKLCFSQTLWGCLQTDEPGRAQFDADADAAVAGRRAALELVKRAGALLQSGDQHLASLVRHGLDGFDDGPVQFVAPAAGNAWQRWFEPAGGLPNPGAAPHTGDFTDAYGNRMRVLAVANPKLTKAAFRAARRGRNAELGDRDRKREGYGLVRVDKRRRRFVIECWPWDGDPQFEGWPYELPFPEV